MNPRRWVVVAVVGALLVIALLIWRAERRECASWQGAAQTPEGTTWAQCGDHVTRKLVCENVPQPPPGKNRPTSNAPSPCTCFVDGKTTATFQLDNAWDALASVNSTTETANAHGPRHDQPDRSMLKSRRNRRTLHGMPIAVTARMRPLLCVVSLVLFGCGSDDSGSNGNPSTGGSAGTGGTASGGSGNTGTGGTSTGGTSTGGAAGSGTGGSGTGGSGTGGNGATGGGGGPLDNPDNYTAAAKTFRCSDYDAAGADPAFKLLDIAALTHEPTGGWNGSGAWQLTPHPIPGAADDNEGLAGWKWWPEAGIAAGSTDVLVVSYLLLLSPQFVDDVKTQNYPNENYGICKTIDLQMWNDGGTAPDYDTRQIVQMLGWRDAEQDLPAGGIYLAHVNGGAGGRYVNDGVNTPLNLAEHPGEWVWVSHVFDSRAGMQKTTTYYKRPGDPGVTRSLVRPGDLEFNFAGTYSYTSEGWAAPTDGYNSALWGYWGDINDPHDDDRYVKLDGMCSGDGWLAPPF